VQVLLYYLKLLQIEPYIENKMILAESSTSGSDLVCKTPNVRAHTPTKMVRPPNRAPHSRPISFLL
jgi:hypothetical protein